VGEGQLEAQKVWECERSARVGNKIHSDLWGPAPVETINRWLYYISFTDNFSCHSTAYLLCEKSEALTSYKSFEAQLLTQYDIRMKWLHMDRVGEYLSNAFNAHLAEMGTTWKLTVHDIPEYNGVSEHLKHTILKKVRAMIHDSGLPKFLWGEAIQL
jgi:hypothetical protein